METLPITPASFEASDCIGPTEILVKDKKNALLFLLQNKRHTAALCVVLDQNTFWRWCGHYCLKAHEQNVGCQE